MNPKSIFFGAFLCLGLGENAAFGQQPTLSPSPLPIPASPLPLPIPPSPIPSGEPSAITTLPTLGAPIVNEGQRGAASDSSLANPYAGELLTRLRLTGDWWGWRSTLADSGLTFDLFATQFYQGVTGGGLERDWAYGGKFDYLFNVDGQKLGLWQGLFVNMHAETRYRRSINDIDGMLAPSNLPLSFPEPEGNITSITGLKITQALTKNLAFYFGKINTLDEYPIRYSPGLGTNKPGLEGFMNTSLVFNPIAGRTIPYSAAGAGLAILNEGEPLFTLTAFDPEERATKGLDGLFDQGVVIVPDLVLRGKVFGLPNVLNIGGTYSNAKYRSFDPAAYLNILNEFQSGNREAVKNTPQEKGSWSVYTNMYQALWADADDVKRNWGVFGQVGFSDGNPNPVRYVVNGGIGGRSMFPGRTYDTFGVGFFYLGLSNNFKTLARPISPQRDEYGVEVFYNYAITPWCRLTGDLQIARPSTAGLDTTIMPGIRLQLLF